MFSVVMVAWNAGKYIRASIESILAQTYRDFELIIVENGSDDDTRPIAQEYAAKDSRVRLILHAENRKIAGGRNAGLNAAQRDWIVIQDADDVALPERLQWYADAIRDYPDVIAWGGWAQNMSADGQLFHRLEMGPATREAFTRLRARSEPVFFKDPAFTYRRNLGQQVGGYSTVFLRVPDLDLMDRMSDLGIMLTIPKVMTHYRVHPGATTQGHQERNNLEIRYIFYRRSEQNAARPLPSFDDFLAWYHGQPWWILAKWRLVDLSRERRYRLPIHLAQKAYPHVAADVLIAVLANPAWFLSRVSRVLGHW